MNLKKGSEKSGHYKNRGNGMKKFKSKLLKFLSVVVITVISLSTVSYGTVYAEETSAPVSEKLGSLFINEDNFIDTMKTVVEPYLASITKSGYIVGENEGKLYYETYVVPNAKGSIVISHGFTENLSKYREMVYYFTKQGYSVYAMEHRGHGYSVNLGEKDSTQINVEKFDYYVTDLKKFLDEIVIPNKGEEKLLLYAHSMGGGIGTKFLEDYPEYFDAAILSSPMLEINTGNVPSWIAKIIASGAVTFSMADNYVSGQGPYDGAYDFDGSGTTSKSRYDYAYEITSNTEEYQKGGASYRWLQESFNATKKIISKNNASKVEIPVLLFQADNDTYVNDGGQNTFAKYAKNCELVFVEGSKHELYKQSDDILTGYLDKVFEFYDNNVQ